MNDTAPTPISIAIPCEAFANDERTTHESDAYEDPTNVAIRLVKPPHSARTPTTMPQRIYPRRRVPEPFSRRRHEELFEEAATTRCTK